VAGSPSGSSTSRWRWSGHVQGGLGYVTILASCALASLSGSAAADAAALAALLVPMMVAAGHRKMYAAGLVAAGGIIAPVIPPSIGLCCSASLAASSISKLFLAGVFSRPDARCWPCFAWWWVRARGKHREPAAQVAARDRLGLYRRLLGADAACHHHRTDFASGCSRHRSCRRRRRLRAVRRDLHLPPNSRSASSTRSSSRRR